MSAGAGAADLLDMAAVNQYVVLSQPDKLVLLAEIPVTDTPDSQSTTLRLLVEQSYRCGGENAEDVDTIEDATCRVPLRDLGCQGAVDRAFQGLVAKLHNPMLRPEVAPEAKRAAARVRARCVDRPVDELGGVEFRLRVVLVDAFYESSDSEETESGSDMEFGYDVSIRGDLDDDWCEHNQTVVGDDEDADGHFLARPYHSALMREGGPSDGKLVLSGFDVRSDGPELSDQHELTSWDTHHLMRLALNGGGNMEDDEVYQRALDGGTPVSRVSRAALLDQALQSVRRRRRQQQPTPPSRIFPMRTGF